MACCDYDVTIYPELVNQRETRKLLAGNSHFPAVLGKRSCKAQNPCDTYQQKLDSGAKRSSNSFPCKFSPEKLSSQTVASDYCLNPNMDADYFGSCSVVTLPEFKLLLAADRSRQSNRLSYKLLLAGGAGCVSFAMLSAAAVLCIERQHRTGEPAGVGGAADRRRPGKPERPKQE